MTEENQKPSIEEQYAVALANGAQSRVVLAAGLQRERAGVLLLRLRAEYDAARGEMERAGQIAPSAAGRIRDLQREESRQAALAKRLDALALAETDLVKRGNTAGAAHDAWKACADLAAEIASIQRRTPAEVMSARAVILVSLTTLHDARQELGALAVRMGANPKRGLAPAIAMQLAGRVLDVWLDQTCHRCDGTGKLGNRFQGDVERDCPTCKGSGHRRETMGEDEKGRMFARDLYAEVESQVAAAAAGIRAAIHAEAEPGKPIHPELARRLAELRGEQAAAD